MRAVMFASILAASASAANAQDTSGNPEAGRAFARQVCSPCHAFTAETSSPRLECVVLSALLGRAARRQTLFSGASRCSQPDHRSLPASATDPASRRADATERRATGPPFLCARSSESSEAPLEHCQRGCGWSRGNSRTTSGRAGYL